MTFYRPSRGIQIGLVLSVCWLSDRALNEPGSAEIAEADFGADFFTEDDALLTRLIAEGRNVEAKAAARTRISARPAHPAHPAHPGSCSGYELAVEAARRGGWLSELASDLLERSRREPFDPHRLYGLATAFAELGEDQRARNLFGAAIHRRSPCFGAYAKFLHLSAKRGKVQEAGRIFESLVRSREASAHAATALGLARQTEGEGLAARKAFEDALIATRPTPAACYELASHLMRGGRFEGALQVSQLGWALASVEGRPEIQIRLLRISGLALVMLGKRSQAIEGFDRALAIAEDWKVDLWIADTLLDRSDLESASGDGGRARLLLDRAALIDDRPWAPRERAMFHLRLANSWLGASDLTRAKIELEQALQLALTASEPHIETDVRLALVHYWTTSGESTLALEEGARVLSLAIELEDGERQARGLAALAAVYDRLGRYRDALESYRQALRFEERSTDRHRQALTLGNISLVYLRMGLAGPAVVHASQALELGRVFADMRLQVSLRQSLAAALAGAGDFTQSERTYAEALILSRSLPTPLLQGLVLAGRARVLLALGRIDDAERSFREALELARRNHDSLLLLQSQSGLALADWRRGRFDSALAYLEESRRLVETSRETIRSESDRMAYSETSSQIYANLAAILTELDRLEPHRGHRLRAFLTIERARARSLLDLLEGSGRSNRPLVGPRMTVPVEADDWRLGEDEILAVFELGERSSTLWILSPAGLTWRELPPRATIEASLESFLDTVRVPPRSPANPFDRHREHARNLYSMLLSPAEPELREAKRIIISPDADLYRLPFEALLARGEDGRERYLIETHTVSYTPSASVLVNLRRRPRGATPPKLSFLGIAQPGGGDESFGFASPIPHAVEEVERVGALFLPDERRLFVAHAADEGVVKTAPRSRMIHIAAHGVADERFPLRSALFIGTSPSSAEDGILSMAEVLTLEIDSSLVVLSACETGRGRLLRSEGALGFSWAFLSAGATTVAVSLWNVNDRATAELMVPFYEAMARERTLAEAMAVAKRTMLRSERRAYRHPYYWAPFVLMGSADRPGFF